MKAYMVLVKRGPVIDRSFEAMSADSITCVQQHMGVLEDGEKIEVMSLDAWREREQRRLAADLSYPAARQAREQQQVQSIAEREILVDRIRMGVPS